MGKEGKLAGESLERGGLQHFAIAAVLSEINAIVQFPTEVMHEDVPNSLCSTCKDLVTQQKLLAVERQERKEERGTEINTVQEIG